MLRSMINHGVSFLIMANQLYCFFIERSLNGDLITGNSTICSGSMFCSCPNSTFLSYNSSINCGNSLEGCSLKVEGSSAGIHTLYGMSSYDLTITTNQNGSVCKTEPIVKPIFIQDYQNTMKFLVNFSPYLEQGFFASIINTTKVQLKVMLHLNGLLLKLFINCDKIEQCVAIKFEGQSEYPLTESSISNATGFTTPIPVKTTTTTTTTGPSTTVLTTISTTTSGLNSTTLATTTTTSASLPNTSESTTSARSNLSTNLISTSSPNTTTSIITDIPLNNGSFSTLISTSSPNTSTSIITNIPLNNGSFSTIISTSSPNTTTNVKTDIPLNNGSFSTVNSSNFSTTIITTQNASAFTDATPVVTIITESSEIVTLTTNVITTNKKSNGTTNLPAKSDAIVGKASYIGQIVVGIAAFLVLLVIVLILVLAYKKRREKSFFRIPPTTPAALDSTEGPQNNHASIIRMESNSLSTLPSTLNNFQVKSNPLYDNYYEQPTQNIVEESPTTANETPVYQTVKPDLHSSYNNPTFEQDVEKKQKKKRVLFAPLPPPPPPPPQENDYTESDEKNLIDFPSNNFIKNDTEKQYQGSSKYDYNRAITEI
ncbi:mucin-2 isoform X2 [Hydra vulgaris]|uniref:Mucin-2 isoform X2 n=1 Tax=Hydra vulgaris TaxID=6087 RepID=A0ABM4DJC4_HYDVU